MPPLPSDPHPTPAADARGARAERDLLRRDMHADGLRLFIPDGAVLVNGCELYFVEVKAQEMFTAPPFDGHGLPVHQVECYMAAYELTGLRTQLRVYDPSGHLYRAWLDDLEAGWHFDTNGTIKTPRRIYPVEHFNCCERPDVADPRLVAVPSQYDPWSDAA